MPSAPRPALNSSGAKVFCLVSARADICYASCPNREPTAMDQIGKYEVIDKIGSGGFAVVYRGRDPFIKRPVAIKVCYSRDEETRKRFHREAEIAGRLVHRNITAVYDFGLHEQMPYLVEEYLPGEDLAHMISRHEPETLEEKLDVLLQIASGLGYAHSRDVIHRDIKPSNVRILDNGRAKIMDFGTAKLATVESNLTQTGMTLGTVAYLSPERLLGEPSGTNSDIFSLGVLAYELFSFRRPFFGRNIPNLIDQVLNAAPRPLEECWPECPHSLSDIVHKCLIKDPALRYASCFELIDDLEQVRATHTTSIPAVSHQPVPAASGANLQLSGLLERARELVRRKKHSRAEMLLDEVLEINPGNTEALRLLTLCRQSTEATAAVATQAMPIPARVSGLDSQAADPETPEARRRRKMGEAVISIEKNIETLKLVDAANELKFATELFGNFGEDAALKKRIVGALKTDIAAVQVAGIVQARQVVKSMSALREKNLLPIELAERLVGRIDDFDPDDLAGKHILTALNHDARRNEQLHETDARARKMQEAIESIEKLLSDGDPATAEQALHFAVQLFGEFEQRSRLQQRISEALSKTEG